MITHSLTHLLTYLLTLASPTGAFAPKFFVKKWQDNILIWTPVQHINIVENTIHVQQLEWPLSLKVAIKCKSFLGTMLRVLINQQHQH